MMSQINKIFELSQKFYFEAAHTLNRSYESEGSKKIHGHTYHAEITITGTPEIDSGMILMKVNQIMQLCKDGF